jgi:hypothetical protein
VLRAILILLAISQVAAAPIPTYGRRWDGAEKSVSVVALLADPSQYDGQRLQVEGFLNLQFEGNALYLDKAEFEADLSRNAVWIDLPRGFDKRLYATVDGVFVASGRGHLGAYSGTITDIGRIAPSMTRDDFESYMADNVAAAIWRDSRTWLLLIGAFAVVGGSWLGMARRRRA